MEELGLRPKRGLEELGIKAERVYWNLSVAELVEHALKNGEGQLAHKGALCVDTGKFTGRSPKDRFIVKDDITEKDVWWGDINIPFESDKFDQLQEKLVKSLEGRTLYVRDAFAGANENKSLKLRVINTVAWHNLFCYNMFLRPYNEKLEKFDPSFTIICNPDFEADPEIDGTRQKNFAIINFTKKMIIIGGTAYSGEMKKGIFGVMNFLLPKYHNTLAMHCSANIGRNGDTAVFFGLSGTGKTTLSADPERGLIGDDEHGWDDNSVFNFEGGCYAKVIDLTRESEPDIWDAIRFESIVENTRFLDGRRRIDYTDSSVTENTRASYPVTHIHNAVIPSIGGVPQNIFFLTCDAFGVLPPIAKLTPGQAMYHFISGYTAKVAGTELGITEPKAVFSACFGAPFMPLHPTVYAEMLGKKMAENNVNVWMINTGWTGGPYGVGSRMKLQYTRATITAALNGSLDNVEYHNHTVFGMAIPFTCPNVPAEILSPKATWNDDNAFYEKTNELANAFINNFKGYEDFANEEIMAGAPVPKVLV